MNQLNSKGFATLEIIISVVVVAAIGGVGWYVLHGKKQASITTNTKTTQSSQAKLPSNTSQQLAASTVSPSTQTPAATTPSTTPKSTTTTSGSNTTTPATTNTTSPATTPSFDIQSFYDHVQNGMDYSQVQTLAGSTGQCATTNSIPANMTCNWSDGSKYVYVNFGSTNSVQSKSKTGF